MQCTEIDGIRYYIDDVGKKYRSVTGIISATKPDKDKKSIEQWRSKKGHDAADKIFSDACLRGTATHTAAEQYLLGKDVIIDYEPARPYWESLEPALKPISEVKSMEQAISHPLGYAGRYDLFCTYKGIENTLVDFKTADKVKRPEYIIDYKLQLAAYSGGIFHTFGERVNQGVVIIGIKNRTAQTFVLSREELLLYWDLWKRRVDKYHSLQANKSLDLLEVA